MELALIGLRQSDRAGSTTQFPPHQGTLLPNPNGTLPTNRFIGEPDVERFDTTQQNPSVFF